MTKTTQQQGEGQTVGGHEGNGHGSGGSHGSGNGRSSSSGVNGEAAVGISPVEALSTAALEALVERIVADQGRVVKALPAEAQAGTVSATGGMRAPEVTIAEGVLAVHAHRPSLFAGEEGGAPILDAAALGEALREWQALDTLVRSAKQVGKVAGAARKIVGERVRAQSRPAYAVASPLAKVDPTIKKILVPATKETHRAVATRQKDGRREERAQRDSAAAARSEARAAREQARAARLRAKADKSAGPPGGTTPPSTAK